jgi:hypothetical protein
VPVGVQGVQAWDRYAYVNNNPARFNDPSGHCIDPDNCPSVKNPFATDLTPTATASATPSPSPARSQITPTPSPYVVTPTSKPATSVVSPTPTQTRIPTLTPGFEKLFYKLVGKDYVIHEPWSSEVKNGGVPEISWSIDLNSVQIFGGDLNLDLGLPKFSVNLGSIEARKYASVQEYHVIKQAGTDTQNVGTIVAVNSLPNYEYRYIPPKKFFSFTWFD